MSERRPVWCEHDPFGGVETAERLVARLPNASLELVPSAGHAPWLADHPSRRRISMR
jgi:pimeloyl-ACP methyl ester carboxylesterase